MSVAICVGKNTAQKYLTETYTLARLRSGPVSMVCDDVM